MATFLGCEVRFFERVPFLSGPFFLRSRVRFRVRFLDDAFPFDENFIKVIHGKCVKYESKYKLLVFGLKSLFQMGQYLIWYQIKYLNNKLLLNKHSLL